MTVFKIIPYLFSPTESLSGDIEAGVGAGPSNDNLSSSGISSAAASINSNNNYAILQRKRNLPPDK